MIRSWIWCGTLSTIGLAALVMPETGRRLFSLSEGHGPSLIDALGIVLLVAGWTVLDVATWRRRRTLSLRRGLLVLMAAAGTAAAGLVLQSVLGDHGSWWIVGAVVLALIQLGSAVKATVVERSTSV